MDSDSDNDSSNSVDIESVGGDVESEQDSDSVESAGEEAEVAAVDNVEGAESPEDEDAVAEENFIIDLQGIRNNDPDATTLEGRGEFVFIENVTNEEWEEIGRDMSNNTHLKILHLYDDALNDEKASFLFRGLTRCTSLEALTFHNNGLSIEGMRTMVPCLQNANNLRDLNISYNSIHSEGFDMICRALRDSPIENLYCSECGIESIEIDLGHFSTQLKALHLDGNSINAGGCREIAKMLQGADSTLTHLELSDNQIDDEGVAILVDALQSNTSLMNLALLANDGMTQKGKMMLLKLVNDISSIKATLQSNHKMWMINVVHPYFEFPEFSWRDMSFVTEADKEIQRHINVATDINMKNRYKPEAAGREKVICTQLNSARREALAELQGVRSQSLHSDINPLHLPEVLSLVGRRHGLGELFIALKSSIAGVLCTVQKKQKIKEVMAGLRTERVGDDDAEGDIKRRRIQWG